MGNPTEFDGAIFKHINVENRTDVRHIQTNNGPLAAFRVATILATAVHI